MLAQEISWHLLPNCILQHCEDFSLVSSRVSLNSSLSAQQQSPNIHDSLIFLTPTFIKLQKRYNRTRPTLKHIRLPTALYQFEQLSCACVIFFFFTRMHIAHHEKTYILVFKTRLSDKTHLALFAVAFEPSDSECLRVAFNKPF